MKINAQGHIIGSVSDTLFLKELATDMAKMYADTFTNLTDNSTGVTTGALTLPTVAGLTNSADDDTSLAQKAATETQLGLVKDAFQELATRTIALHTKLGLGTFTYSGGGTAADGTIGAINDTITAAATGVTLANLTPIVTAYNGAAGYLARKINEVAVATGTTELDVTAYQDVAIANPSALSTNTGTAADPALTAVQVGVIIKGYEDNIGRMAAKLNDITTLGNANTSVVK
jgi:hypothetical protein